MSFTAMRIIERVIATADAGHPADRMLKEELQAVKSLSAPETTEISRTVFAYFRWFGWLDSGDALRTKLERAQELDHRFRQDPHSFPAAELIERAVPKWIASETKVTADWARALQAEPAVWLRAKSGRTEEVTMALGDCRALGTGPLANALEYTGEEDLFRTSMFHAGSFEIQDVNSQLVGLVCAPRPGETWWDACAGKAASCCTFRT